MKINSLAIVFFLIFTGNSFANITLSNIFSDNMVLQRNSKITIWGWANPQEDVVIRPSWNSESYSTKTNNQAKWEIELQTPKEGGPYTITIKGYNEIVLNNVLIGEVWLCSGQSNMEMSASWGIEGGDDAIKNATNPNIRFFTVPKSTANTPQNNVLGSWKESTPETMKYFSAVGYFFAQQLQEELKNVPIGLIGSYWGGTPAEIWIPEERIVENPLLLDASKKLKEQVYGPNQPGRAFNAMIAPLLDYKIAGVIWYQGESNKGSTVYDKTFSTLINSWRKLWGYDFPFYYAQIAPYKYDSNSFNGVLIRDAQRRVLGEVPNCAMVMTSDVSTNEDLHPKNKKAVGIRLANLALANIYKTNSNLVNGPLYKEIQINKNKVTVYFDYAEGLHFTNDNCQQFEIAGADNVFHQANAMIKNNKIILTSSEVEKPIRVRFAWKNSAYSELFNKANLPASSFLSE